MLNVEEIKKEAPSLAHGSARVVEFLEMQTRDKSLYHLVFFPILTGPARWLLEALAFPWQLGYP